MDHFAGLDVSVKDTSVCIVDDTGKITREVKVASEPDALLTVLKNPAYHFKRIALEAGPLSQWLFSALAEADLPVICVETRHMRAVLKAQINKTDRNDARGIAQMIRRRQVVEFFKALPPCLVGMEACATAHYWARELKKLDHRVRLMPAKDVKAYVKRNKNDAADAEAICEAVRRPGWYPAGLFAVPSSRPNPEGSAAVESRWRAMPAAQPAPCSGLI